MATTRETDTDLFEGTAERTVEVSLLEETYQDILALCEEEGWTEDEGLRTVMAHGLAYLRGNLDIKRLEADDVDLAAELQRRIRQVAEYHGMYSVMKFKAFELLQMSRILEINTTGLRGELGLARNTIPKLHHEIDELKAENAELRERLPAANSTPGANATPETDDQAGTPSPSESRDQTEPSPADANAPWDRLRQWITGAE